jgi:transposase
MRKSYDKKFKAKVALETVRGEKTIQEIATAFSIHPNLVGLWKKQLLESADMVFERAGKEKDDKEKEEKESTLYRQIGQLQVENEFLKKKYRQLYGSEPKL